MIALSWTRHGIERESGHVTRDNRLKFVAVRLGILPLYWLSGEPRCAKLGFRPQRDQRNVNTILSSDCIREPRDRLKRRELPGGLIYAGVPKDELI